MRIRLWPAAALFVLVGSSAAPTALPNCLDQVAQNLEAVGRPEAGEVASELRELQRMFDGLNAEARRLADEQEALDDEQARLERAQQERGHRLAGVQRELTIADSETDDLQRRFSIHNAEAMQQRAAAGAANTPEAAASANGWGSRINARKALLDREAAALVARIRQLEAQQTDLMHGADVIAEASRFRYMHAGRERVDRELDAAIGRCAALLPRSLALTRIANAPARDIDYRAPSEIADNVVRSLAEGVGGNVATIAFRHSQSGRSLRRGLFPAVRSMSRLGLTAARANVAVLATELATEALLAGANQNEREVVRNIYLIGDYAEALKVLFQERGAGATASPEYLAIRGELERLRAEMPGGEAEFLLDSAAEPAALVGAFLGIARRYVGGRVSRLAASRIAPLPPTARHDTSASALRALREAQMSSLTVPADVAVGTAIEAVRDEGAAVANRIESSY